MKTVNLSSVSALSLNAIIDARTDHLKANCEFPVRLIISTTGLWSLVDTDGLALGVFLKATMATPVELFELLKKEIESNRFRIYGMTVEFSEKDREQS